jgi:small-conductance mechanosensitive channel
MLHQVRSEIYNELNSRGIDIPYDQLVLHKADAG